MYALDFLFPLGENLLVIAIDSRFQLEAEKLNRHVVFQVTVYKKKTKNSTRLFAETQCSDPYNYMVQFVIRECTDFDDLLTKFLAQLDYRGYSPLRYRKKEGGVWGEWIPIPPRPAAGRIPEENPT